MHPLLEARSASAAAVKMSIAASSGYMLRANGQDAIWPCAGASRRNAGRAAVILVLEDGEPGCTDSSSGGNRSASTWWMSDPRGGSAYRLPSLFQMGADANVCARTSEVWVIPPGVPLTFPPHRWSRSMVLLVADVKVEYVHEGALLAFLAAEASQAGSGQPSEAPGQRADAGEAKGEDQADQGGLPSRSGQLGRLRLLGISGVSKLIRQIMQIGQIGQTGQTRG